MRDLELSRCGTAYVVVELHPDSGGSIMPKPRWTGFTPRGK